MHSVFLARFTACLILVLAIASPFTAAAPLGRRSFLSNMEGKLTGAAGAVKNFATKEFNGAKGLVQGIERKVGQMGGARAIERKVAGVAGQVKDFASKEFGGAKKLAGQAFSGVKKAVGAVKRKL
ncbi:hypothetical protein DFJ73DRAFT_927190 [Zopfochytrium polystomum]|nr:hypothetical protein DFJ73DRAFT_927190 [Zopfochytrium polystomum]